MFNKKAARSARAFLSRLRWWWGFWMPLVMSIILLGKVLPGGTTSQAQAKFNNPTSDCNSRSVAVRFPLNALIVCLNLISLSSGRQTQRVNFQTHVNVVVGNRVFFGIDRDIENHQEYVHNVWQKTCFGESNEGKNWIFQRGYMHNSNRMVKFCQNKTFHWYKSPAVQNHHCG